MFHEVQLGSHAYGLCSTTMAAVIINITILSKYVDTHLNYYDLKILIKINYHPQTFRYLILYLCESSGVFPIYRYPVMWCPPRQSEWGVCGEVLAVVRLQGWPL